MKANIKRWLEEAEKAHGGQIIAGVVGLHYADDFGDPDRRPVAQRDALLNRAELLALCDEDFNSGFGGADCFPIYAWSASRVFLISEYDGATRLISVPRHPLACSPEFA